MTRSRNIHMFRSVSFVLFVPLRQSTGKFTIFSSENNPVQPFVRNNINNDERKHAAKILISEMLSYFFVL